MSVVAHVKTIVAVGEALWDVFPEERRPGGAPCNVAYHAACLGDLGAIVTRVGSDMAGTELIAFLNERGVATEYVQRDSDRPTGTVSVTVERSDLRYEIMANVAWDYIALPDDARALTRAADVICVGSLAQRSVRSRATIQQILSEAHGHSLIVFDVNLRPPFVNVDVTRATLRYADVVKMNEAEVAYLSDMFDQPSLAEWLIETVGVRMVCVTRGENGASMTTQRGTISIPGVVIDAAAGDAVGAGDAFTAAVSHQLVRDATPEETLHTANQYAALVASKKGAMPVVSSHELANIGL